MGEQRKPDASNYRQQRQREKAAAWSRRNTASLADVGELPAVVNPKRREACRLDLHRFLAAYFPASTGLKPFSADHRRVIEREQQCVLYGGWFANIVYRGFAKTTIGENTAIWATLYGHRKFVPIFGATAKDAEDNIGSIKLELSENDLLLEDFPEICHPIRSLEGKSQRCASQTFRVPCDACGGVEGADECERCSGAGRVPRLTHIEWKGDTIVLPTIQVPEGWGTVAGPKDGANLIEAPGSGGIITARGLSGSARGMKHKRPDGTQQRPDFVIIDDPQTDESAGSPLQVHKGLSRIKKSVLKLGGHSKKIAALMNATVIARGDLIEQVLDAKKNPAWQCERIKMVRAWAGAAADTKEKYLGARAGGNAHETLWIGEYARIRNEFDRNNPDDQKRAHKAATSFYRKNRREMDAGAEVSWVHCYDPDSEISAVQHAYNMLIDDHEEVFASEFQNEPLAEQAAGSATMLTADQIASKLSSIPREMVPIDATRIVAFIDPKETLLYWVVAAFNDQFDGWVIDYGTDPDQGRAYFASREAKNKLKHPDGMEAAVDQGLDELVKRLAGRKWHREDGAEMPLERCLIDARYGKITDTVKAFCRRSAHAAVLHPSQGLYFGASTQRTLRDYRRKPGDRAGLNWRIAAALAGNRRTVRTVQFDTNFWKSFLHERLATAAGGKGSMFLFGDKPERHKLFADHLIAETPVEVMARGRTVVEWKEKAGVDNDYFDCLVGCAVAASIGGSQLERLREAVVTVKRVRLSEIQQRRQLRRPQPTPAQANHAEADSGPAKPDSSVAVALAPAPQHGYRRRIRLSDLQRAKREGTG